MDAAALFEDTMAWLRDSYEEHRFFVERDVVWTAQLRLLREAERAKLPCRVLNDYTLFERTRADLAILDGSAVEVAAEFKYEPARARSGEFGDGKFPVVDWRSVEMDVQRVHDYVAQGKAKTAYAVLIDEGGHFRGRAPHPGSEWRDWSNGVWALWTKVSGAAAYKAPPAGGAPDALSSGEPRQVAAPGEWVPLTSKESMEGSSPPILRFPDDSARALQYWNDLLPQVVGWLWESGRLTMDDIPVPSGPKRFIANMRPYHTNERPFDFPKGVEGAPLVVETDTGDQETARKRAVKLLRRCGVDPNDVLALR